MSLQGKSIERRKMAKDKEITSILRYRGFIDRIADAQRESMFVYIFNTAVESANKKKKKKEKKANAKI
ncbi:MAG TPA: hypothetical protein DCM40_29015 [Maribacter sp.]|nr:hypothetical protein [Maribacter sp.]